MPGFKFTINQSSDINGGFTPVTAFDPNRVLVSNQYGYAESSDFTIADLENTIGFTNFIFNNIAALRAYNNPTLIPLLKVADVLGYYVKGDEGGGNFTWNPASTAADNGGTIIQPTGITTGRWERVMDGKAINCRIFGCKGDGITDDSARFQALIDTFAPNTVATPTGVAIEIPAGKFILGDIQVPPGVRIFSEQTAKYIYIPTLACEVYPAPGADYVFYFTDGCINSELEGIYIDGDFSNNPNLLAAVRFTGNGCNLRRSLFNRCAQAAVISSAGNGFIEKCGIFGWYGPAPVFTGINDFRGALHILAMGDFYIRDNEIGAGLPYFATYPDPLDMLRDPVNRRICSMAAVGFAGTSVISGNLFENGDSGVVFASTGLYCTFHNNRYELSGGGGLRTVTGASITFFTFASERFADNSLAGDGVFDDVDMSPGSAGFVVFDCPIFEKIFSPFIPTSNYKTRWHFNNKASTEFDIITPQVDATYTGSGLLNNVDVDAFPMRQVKGQYFPDEPIYNKVTVTGPANQAQKGYVILAPGTDAGSGGYPGAVQFWNASNDIVSQIGFTPAGYFGFTMLQPYFWLFSGGDMTIAKAGSSTLTVQSTDAAGDTVIKLANDIIGTKTSTLTQDKTTGALTLLSASDININPGAVAGWKFLSTGQSNIPVAPTDSASGYSILSRNTVNGNLEKVPAASVFTLQTGTPTVVADAAITGTVTVAGNDTRGTVFLNISAPSVVAANGALFTLTFSTPYPGVPGIVFSPESDLATQVTAYKKNAAAASFQIASGLGGSFAVGGYSFSYIIIK